MGKFISLALSLIAALMLSTLSCHAEGCTRGAIDMAGAASLDIGRKTIVVGVAPVRTNRFYYRVMVA